ncbi:MAG: Crp/Fnr family transcriptional regulator [Acidobacteria bacterium]|nr:MAG: Crp/Fnr family transcriptional regulator [Acidobacteriota bacterium]
MKSPRLQQVRPEVFLSQAGIGGAIIEVPRKLQQFQPEVFLSQAGIGREIVEVPKNKKIFSQGEVGEAVFYIQKGRAKLSVLSREGKEATISLFGPGDFVGEDCIAGVRSTRMASATAMTACTVLRIERKEMMRVIHEEHFFSDIFVVYLLARNTRIQADLVDQLFNSSEKRLARALLLLANFGKEGKPETVIPKVSQEILAEMIGTTRSRVSFFMNRFRKLGFIEYNGTLQIHSSLLNVVLHD